jgi:hypothetical protein
MLKPASDINGCAIAAADGEIGHVSDVLFEDDSWLVRWVVVDCGNWMTDRKVLLPPSALGHLDLQRREFSVRLTREQVKDSPDVDTDRSVTRHMEGNVYNHYGWTPYWGTGFFFGGGGYVGGAMSAPYLMARDKAAELTAAADEGDDDDAHLRSANSVKGYHLQATDGDIGHVQDLLLEDADWSLRYLVVETSNWWPGKRVLISPGSVLRIDWSDRKVEVRVDREKVKTAPAFDKAASLGRGYNEAFDRHYADVTPTGFTEIKRPTF